MFTYLIRRLLFSILTIILLSIVSFMIVNLPAGDLVDSIAAKVAAGGRTVDQTMLDNLRHQYGLDQPMYIQYFHWAGNLLQGNLGWSFSSQRPVSELIGERVQLTASISLITLMIVYLLSIPIGIYSATHQYTPGDYFFMLVGFVGMATPSFLFALILMIIFFNAGISTIGLFSIEYMRAPWSILRVVDLLKHLPIPILIIGTAGTAGLIRVMRATLLDELGKQYVITARAKGVNEIKLLFKYPVRVALNPIASTIGWELPGIVSGGLIVEMVLNLPTVGPMLYQAILAQDVFLSSSLLLILSTLTIIGTFISDILLVVIDPRIRFRSREA
jgi:peptide/nickel transport system permease protein